MRHIITLDMQEIARACAYWFARTGDLSAIPGDVNHLNVVFRVDVDSNSLIAEMSYSATDDALTVSGR